MARVVSEKVAQWLTGVMERQAVAVRLGLVGVALLVVGFVLDKPWLWAGGIVAVAGAFVFAPRRKSLPVVDHGEPWPRCEGCVSFDLQMGQETLDAFPNFPSKLMNPDQLGAKRSTVTDAPDGFPIVGELPPRTLERLAGRVHSWRQYGVCAKDRVLVNQYDLCDGYKAKAG